MLLFQSCVIHHLANLKPAALPVYTHRSSERKPASVPPECCWEQFHLHCYCYTSGTLHSWTSQWSTIDWLNGSRLRKLPGTCEGKRSHWSHTRWQKWDLTYRTVSSRTDRLPNSDLPHLQCTWPWPFYGKHGTQKVEAFFPMLPFSLKTLSNFFYEYWTQLFLPCSIKFLVNKH